MPARHRSKILPLSLLSLLLLGGAGRQAVAQELSFATVEASRQKLETEDDFTRRMTPFDRAARLQTDRPVTVPAFLAFAAAAASPWQESEIKAVKSAFDNVRPGMAQLRLPLPKTIFVIKTTGREEGHAPYTRGDAIILPANELGSSPEHLRKILAHESFHIASRQHPELARALYGVIGFRYCGEATLPADLAARKVTNPDAPRSDYAIRLRYEGRTVSAMPVLLSSSATYDVARGGEFFDYLKLAYLLVDCDTPEAPPGILRHGPQPYLLGLEAFSGFFEQVGRNTDYIIHPEEILADNFAALVLGRTDMPSPDVPARIRKELASFAARPAPDRRSSKGPGAA